MESNGGGKGVNIVLQLCSEPFVVFVPKNSTVVAVVT